LLIFVPLEDFRDAFCVARGAFRRPCCAPSNIKNKNVKTVGNIRHSFAIRKLRGYFSFTFLPRSQSDRTEVLVVGRVLG